MSGDRCVWLFGYGSLIWRPSFPYVSRTPGFIEGWARRFWQSSPDHRGTPEMPGRVVTLIPMEGACCWGVVYGIDVDIAPEVLSALDAREQAGYIRESVVVHRRGLPALEGALTYIAPVGNGHAAGPAPDEVIVAHIRRAHGPSGSNLEYLLRLADALRDMNAPDEHVQRLAELARVRESAD